VAFASAFLEQLDRLRVPPGGGQTTERVHRFAADPQRLPGGDDHVYAGTAPKDGLDQRRDRAKQVLTVVDDQERRPVGQPGDERVQQVLPGFFGDPEYGRDERADQLWPGGCAQFDQPDSVRVPG
jgi:hypothetical protein